MAFGAGAACRAGGARAGAGQPAGARLDAGPGGVDAEVQSIKNATKAEFSGFATFSGAITPDGAATLRVALTAADLCEQGKTLDRPEMAARLELPHPYGAAFKQALRTFAAGGCRGR